jgi:hypothetical protein
MEDPDDALTIHLLDRIDPSAARAVVSIGGLLLEVLSSGGTTAEASQSMLKGAIESRYEDYFFSEGTDAEIENEKRTQSHFLSQRADFVAVQVPGGWSRPANRAAGDTQLYMLVMAAVIIHSVLVWSIVVWFLLGIYTQYEE